MFQRFMAALTVITRWSLQFTAAPPACAHCCDICSLLVVDVDSSEARYLLVVSSRFFSSGTSPLASLLIFLVARLPHPPPLAPEGLGGKGRPKYLHRPFVSSRVLGHPRNSFSQSSVAAFCKRFLKVFCSSTCLVLSSLILPVVASWASAPLFRKKKREQPKKRPPPTAALLSQGVCLYCLRLRSAGPWHLEARSQTLPQVGLHSSRW